MLECFAFYAASHIALSEQYGLECKVELYEEYLETALRYLFLAQHCSENFTESIYCEIKEFIDDLQHTGLYKLRANENCDDSPYAVCTLTIIEGEVVNACTDNLSINILR